MARLGEQLASAGIVSADKVEQALRAQVVWGARLGTNLIELGCIDLDELSRALGQLHGVPAALARHFDKADPDLQALLPTALAKQFSIVPLVRLSPERIAIVALDPLGRDALAALAAIYGVDADSGIVMSVAAEMRVLYHLERVYKIARSTRYLRSKGASVTPFPQFDLSFELDVDVEPEVIEELAPIDVDIEVEVEVDIESPGFAPLERQVPQISEDDFSALLDQIEVAPALETGPVGRERRTYLRTLADDVGPAKPPAVQIPPKPPARPAPPSSPPVLDAPTARASFDSPTLSAPAATANALRADAAASGQPEPIAGVGRPITGPIQIAGVGRPITGPIEAPALARIAIRRVAVTPSSGTPSAADSRNLPASNFLESTRAIKRGPNRDRVAELVIEALDRYVPTCASALLLVIRGDVAIGWKHFSRADDGTSEVAVPLDQDGIVPTAIARKGIVRCAAEELGALDGLLLRAVGNGADGELVVVPIAIGDQVMCVLAAATATDAELAPLETVASAASAAFARLIRDASR